MPSFTDNLDLRKMGFIYEATEPTSDSMAMLPMNRTMYVAELTDQPPTKPQLSYDLETVEAVFDHFKPKVKVEFQDESGASKPETLEFKSVGDFGKKSLVENTQFLHDLDEKQKEHQSFSRKLQSNKILQKILSDPTKKTAYVTMLQAMLQELEAGDAG